mmetsp:Transcript_3835/g.7226  ORF Transcript_3835/g.7226 Transcript_3835/m.7226 type:complete len:366 (-) Transcript_3835:20-1117(-)
MTTSTAAICDTVNKMSDNLNNIVSDVALSSASNGGGDRSAEVTVGAAASPAIKTGEREIVSSETDIVISVLPEKEGTFSENSNGAMTTKKIATKKSSLISNGNGNDNVNTKMHDTSTSSHDVDDIAHNTPANEMSHIDVPAVSPDGTVRTETSDNVAGLDTTTISDAVITIVADVDQPHLVPPLLSPPLLYNNDKDDDNVFDFGTSQFGTESNPSFPKDPFEYNTNVAKIPPPASQSTLFPNKHAVATTSAPGSSNQNAHLKTDSKANANVNANKSTGRHHRGAARNRRVTAARSLDTVMGVGGRVEYQATVLDARRRLAKAEESVAFGNFVAGRVGGTAGGGSFLRPPPSVSAPTHVAARSGTG